MTEIAETPKLLARADIAGRLQNFSMLTGAMTAFDAEKITDWIASHEFTETCLKAEVDASKVTRKFHSLIQKGIENNVCLTQFENC